eukprot:m.218099 g.218099  ORF g.218099 m.218099 type:complete len:241 (-) comp15899_c0_seq2:2304-3026(-)
MAALTTHSDGPLSKKQKVNHDASLKATPSSHWNKPLDNSIAEGLAPIPTAAGAFVTDHAKSLLQNSVGADEVIKSKLSNKSVAFTTPGSKVKASKDNSKGWTLSSKQKKSLNAKLLDDCRFSTFIPLHQLWISYITQVLGEKTEDMGQKIAKADYHGAYFMVVKTKCPSMIGLGGIVVQETENMIRLVSEKNQLKSVPKQNTVFSCQVNNLCFHVYGNQIRYKSSERTVRKYKNLRTFEL